MKKKVKRMTLSKETVRLLENGGLKSVGGAGGTTGDTCGYEIGDTTPGHCIIVRCAV
jgi:hypothetical protein